MNSLLRFSRRGLVSGTRSRIASRAYATATAQITTPVDEIFEARYAELSRESGIPVAQIKDPQLHFIMIKIGFLFQKLKLETKEAQDEFLRSVLISPGADTLEWALPSPPPIHTFEELPIIKEPNTGGKH